MFISRVNVNNNNTSYVIYSCAAAHRRRRYVNKHTAHMCVCECVYLLVYRKYDDNAIQDNATGTWRGVREWR